MSSDGSMGPRRFGAAAGSTDSPVAREAMNELLADARQQCRRLADEFAFSWYHLVLRTLAPPALPCTVLVDDSPAPFRPLFDAHVATGLSPIARKAATSMLPFVLRDAAPPQDVETAALLERLQAVGIGDGLVVPLHGPHASHGMLLLMDASRTPASIHLRERLFCGVHWRGISLFEGLVEDIARLAQQNRRRQLTPRQRRALILAAQGQSLAEVGRTLGVHTSTARYLLSRAAEKLGVATRTEAVARIAAMMDFSPMLVARSPTPVDLRHAPAPMAARPRPVASAVAASPLSELSA